MENTKRMYSIRTKDIALIALFTALLAVCSWISVPTAIPFTMQTFGVFLTIGLLGGKRGTAAIGFILTALLMWLAEALMGKSLKVLAASMVAGLIICYAFGTAWFIIVYTKNTGEIGLMTALGWCVFPYIIPDVIKIILAVVLTRRLRPYVDAN